MLACYGFARVAAREADGAVDQAQAANTMLGGVCGIILALGADLQRRTLLVLWRGILSLRVRLRPLQKPSRQPERQKGDWSGEPFHGIHAILTPLLASMVPNGED